MLRKRISLWENMKRRKVIICLTKNNSNKTRSTLIMKLRTWIRNYLRKTMISNVLKRSLNCLMMMLLLNKLQLMSSRTNLSKVRLLLMRKTPMPRILKIISHNFRMNFLAKKEELKILKNKIKKLIVYWSHWVQM